MNRSLACLFILIFIGCSKQNSADKTELSKNYSASQYLQWDVKKQAALIHQLNPKSQMELLKSFMTKGYFTIPPVEYIKFIENGDVLFDWDIDSGGQAGGNIRDKNTTFFFGKWLFSDGKILIETIDNRSKVLGEREEWVRIEVDTPYENDPSFLTFFIVKSDGKPGPTLTFFPEGSGSEPSSFLAYSENSNKRAK